MTPQGTIEVADYRHLLGSLAGGSVDLILTDPPAGVTQADWDSKVDLAGFWAPISSVLKPSGVVLVVAVQPFSSRVVHTSPFPYRYEWIWEKSKATGYLNAKKQPLRAHEHVLVFYRNPGTYNPQMKQGKPYNKGTAHRPTEVYGSQTTTTVKDDVGVRYPRSVLYFKTAESEGKVLHPTQKPLALFEYMVRTYTNPGDLVVDPFVGVGTTALAAARLGRRFVCGDMSEDFVEIARQRVAAEPCGTCGGVGGSGEVDVCFCGTPMDEHNSGSGHTACALPCPDCIGGKDG